jgi:YesN/AraC family two-component response regulator
MIMDPGMDGLETWRHIIQRHPNQRAIIASGYAETDKVKTAQQLGAGEYLKKPYMINTLGKADMVEYLSTEKPIHTQEKRVDDFHRAFG